MNILGVSDGPHAGAALTVNGHLVAVSHQERIDRTPASVGFPWRAVEDVLDIAGVEADSVDLIGIAGRFSPPFMVRRHPSLRALTADPFSPVNDWRVLYHAVLRHSGLGALEADRASDWLTERFVERGFRPQRVILVDAHRALAEAAYRQQDDTTDVLVLTMHPKGDGVAVAVHVGNSAQLDRFWTQKGFASLHAHLARCAASLEMSGAANEERLWGLATRGEPVEELTGLLGEHLAADGLRLSRQSFLVPARRRERVYRALADAAPEDAAASIQANLRHAVQQLVRIHVAHWGIATVALGGSIFDNPRMVAAVAELEEVERVMTGPEPGWGAMAIGAATMLAGRPPRPVRPMGHDLGKLKAKDLKAAAKALKAGKSVALAAGPAGFGPEGGGSRAALIRADEPAGVERLRTALKREDEEQPLVIVLPKHLKSIRHADKLGIPLSYGSVALAPPPDLAKAIIGGVAPDGRARLRAASGETLKLLEAAKLDAVVAFPLGMGREPTARSADDASSVAEAADLYALIARG